MTFEIHDAFKVGDEVKNKENGIIGRVVAIEEYNVLYPYKVKNQDGSVTIHSRNGIVMYKESVDPQPFKLYDNVEIIDPQDPLFGKKGILGYVGIKEGKETKYRIQNEEKTNLWYAFESQLKLVSDEQEEIKTFADHNFNNRIKRIIAENEKLKATLKLEIDEKIELRKQIKEMHNDSKDFEILITSKDDEDEIKLNIVSKSEFTNTMNDLSLIGNTDFNFFKIQGQLKVKEKTIKTYEINE